MKKPFIRICESKLLRRSVLVLCGPREELEKLFFDPKGPFRDFNVKDPEHKATWDELSKSWDGTIAPPNDDTESYGALGFTCPYKGDVFIVLPKWDSRVFIHEAYHAAEAMKRITGMEGNEEIGAYLVEWLFEEICWNERRKR